MEPNPNKENLKQNQIESYFKTKIKLEQKDKMVGEPAVERQEQSKKEPVGTSQHLKSTSKPGTKTKPRVGTKVKTLQLQEGLNTLRNFLETKEKARLEGNQNCTQPRTTKDAADFQETFQREDYRGTKFNEGISTPSEKGIE